MPVSNSFVSPYNNSRVSCLAGGVRLFGCLQFMCLPIHLSPRLAGSVWLSGCLSSLIAQLCSTCFSDVFRIGFPDVVSQMWFPRCCLPVAPKFVRLLSSCLSLVLEGMVSQLSSNGFPQLPFVSQNWSAPCLQVSSISRPGDSSRLSRCCFPLVT